MTSEEFKVAYILEKKTLKAMTLEDCKWALSLDDFHWRLITKKYYLTKEGCKAKLKELIKQSLLNATRST